MPTIPIEQAEHHLTEILETLAPGDEVVLTRNQEPIATLRATPPKPVSAREFGTLKGSVISIAPDFDDIPEGFEDYLP